MNPPHWTFEQIGEMTRTQVALIGGQGTLPDPRRIEFKSVAEAHRWIDETTGKKT